MMKDIVEVRPLGGHRLYLRFEDGVAGELDFADRLRFDRSATIPDAPNSIARRPARSPSPAGRGGQWVRTGPGSRRDALPARHHNDCNRAHHDLRVRLKARDVVR